MRALAVGLIGGSLGVLRLSAAPETVFAAVPLLAASTVAALGICLARRRCPPWAGLALGLLGGALLTLLACRAAASHVIDARLIGVDVVVEGRIVGVPRRDGRRALFELAVDSVIAGTALGADARSGGRGFAEGGAGVADSAAFAPRRLRLARYGHGQRLRAGERWRLTVRLRPISGLRNAGGFDRVRHLLVRGIDASGSVRDHPSPVRLAAARGLDAQRERLADRLAELTAAPALDRDSPAGAAGTSEENLHRSMALTQALTLGVADAVPETTRALLRDTGTAHLLAISGLHVTLVAGWGLWLGRFAARRGGATSATGAAAVGLLTSLSLAAGYALLAGFELPVRRALAMLAVCSLAALRLRALSPGSALGAALVAALLVDPLAPLSVGFWLSFGSVAALLWLHAGHVRGVGEAWEGRFRAVAGLLRSHLLLGVLLLPVTAWFFQSGAWVAPLANAVAVPVVGLAVVPLAFLTLALAVIAPVAGGVALGVLDAIVGALLGSLEALLGASGGAWTLALPSLEALLWCLAALVLLVAPRGLAPRRLAIALVLPALLANGRGPRVEGFELHVLDVGQGLAALVLTPDTTWLYDTGGRLGPELTMLEAVIVPYLHALGRREIDVIVVSHPDSDHAAGLPEARRRWPRARVLVGVPGGEMPPDAVRCGAGQSELHDGVRFAFLHPATHDRGSENDSSCVLLVQLGASRALLSGDIERAGERALVERVGRLPVDVMTAPHHGSRTSSGPALIAAFAPAHVVFPAGARNGFGFPHGEVEMRYKTAGAVAHLTGRDGALRFTFGLDGLAAPPSSWHGTRRRFWHDMVEPP